jgi:hypothetical protein
MSRRFNELIKEFNTIRSYARDFYINGFKQREDFDEKSLRSYDNERRRIESYLHPYIQWEQTAQGKTIRLDLKQEQLNTNPFFKLWQTKSFTKNDIFLHFVLLDCLTRFDTLSLSELTELIHQDYLSLFENAPILSEITVRNKLKEYCQIGILHETEKDKRRSYQFVSPIKLNEKMIPVLHFYKEIFPGGVIGQFLLDQIDTPSASPFLFKHHFIVHSLDELVVLKCLTAITEKRTLHIIKYNNKPVSFSPFSLYISTETGRQYLVGFIHKKLLTSIRIDTIKELSLGKEIKNYLELAERFSKLKNTSWNASFNRNSLKYLGVLLYIEEGKEEYLLTRINREKRMGTWRRIDESTVLFEIELLDLFAINPFLRTFMGRIISIESTDEKWKHLFIHDMKEMIALYQPSEEVLDD